MEVGCRGMSEVIALNQFRHAADKRAAAKAPGTDKSPGADKVLPADRAIFFDRREFSLILNLYSRMVGRGEWRDYAIGHDKESCSFAVFRRSADGALYRIVKTPKLARRQGAFAILGQGGRILRRGRELAVLLRYFEPPRQNALL